MGPLELLSRWLRGKIEVAQIDYAHWHIHEGNMYSASFIHTGVVDNADVAWAILTADEYLHLNIDVATGGNSWAFLHEQPTLGASGTNMTFWNKRRDLEGVKTPTALVFRSPTVVDTGAVIGQTFLPGGEKNFASGGQGGTRNEWILDKNSSYLVLVRNVSGGAIDLSIDIDGYEYTHIDANLPGV